MMKISLSKHLFFIVLLILMVFSTNGVLAATAGLALQFDGYDDFVDLGLETQIIGAEWIDTKSVSLWVRPAGEGQQCAFNDVAYCDAIFSNRPQSWGIRRGVVNGEDRIWVWNFSDGYARIGIEYDPDEWIHIALVHENGILSAYRNGNLIAALESGPSLNPDPNSSLYLGGVIPASDRVFTFKGEIDEVRIFSRALTANEIRATLRSELEGDEEGLAAYYKMSYSTGFDDILSDESIHDRDGQLMSGNEFYTYDSNLPQWVESSAFAIPIANDQFVFMDEDGQVNITLTGSSQSEGILTFSVTTPPENGSLSGQAPDLIYTPDEDFYGQDIFYFTVSDGILTSIPSAVTINVNAVNDAPTGNDDFFEMDQFQELIVDEPGVLENDSDIDSETITSLLVQPPARGQLTFQPDGSFTYIPEPGEYGSDSFTYRVFDGELESTEPVTVTITIQQVVYEVFVPLIVH